MASSLTPEQESALEEVRLIFKPTTSGKRKVSAALLSPPDSAYSSGASSKSGSVRFQSFSSSSSDLTLDLPETANSIEGLEFIGFDHKTATHVFRTYDKYKSIESDDDDFFSFVHGHIIMINSSKFAGSSERESMTNLGIRQAVQDAILDPNFTQVYNTETLEFWIEDTLKVNYATLLRLLGRLQDQANIELSKKTKKQKKRAKLESAFPQASTSAQAAETGIEEDIDAVTLSAESSENFFKHCVVVESPPKALENHTILYKGKAASELVRDVDPFFLENGALNIIVLNSHRGGDFNWLHEVQYWSPEKQTAERYRQYAAERSPFSETWVVRIQVPNEFLAPLRTEQLWYSANWKEYVWWCKRKQPVPEKFHHLSEKADLIKGHICARSPPEVARFKAQDFQTKFTKNDLMYNDGQKATQWVFMKEEKVRQLAQLLKGKVYVEINGPLVSNKND